MKILVTGAAGFIGAHVARQLLEQGHAVVGLDSFNDYYLPALKRTRVRELCGADAFELVELDLCDRARLEELFRRVRPELVVHLAAQAGVRYSLENPHAYVDANLAAFVNVLEQVRRNDVARLIYASSSSVYAGLDQLPYHEAQQVDQPISVYAATKRANELLAHTYSHLYDVQTIGLRFFTVYGPWGRPDMAYWSFTERILAGRSIPVFHRGEARRDFTFIDDAVAGVLALVDAELKARNEIFNVGNDRPVKLLDFISLIERALGRDVEHELLPGQPGDVEATWANIDKLRQAVGYTPATTIEQGIPRFVEWYLTHPEIAREVARGRAAQTFSR